MNAVTAEKRTSVLTPAQVAEALPGALRKLDPRALVTTPVMLVVEAGAVVTTVLSVIDPSTLGWSVTVWLWLTVVFGNLAESVAEGRGKAQAASLRELQTETPARRRTASGGIEAVSSTSLRAGDIVVVEAGERIPGDGDVIEGVASVDESAVTGESAPVIRESGGDRSAVTGGTIVLSDQIVVRITSEPGQSFVDRMIALVEGASRQRTPNEIALNILLASLSIIFVVVVVYALDLPYTPGGLPWNEDFDASLVNYTPFAIVIPLIFGVWYLISAKNTYKGPVSTLEEDVVTRD